MRGRYRPYPGRPAASVYDSHLLVGVRTHIRAGADGKRRCGCRGLEYEASTHAHQLLHREPRPVRHARGAVLSPDHPPRHHI